MLTAAPWVETAPCHLAAGCDWSGMHWHWGPRRFHRIAELTPEECIAFDADCRLTNALRALGDEMTDAMTTELELAGITAPAGRRHPERSTMPARSNISGLDVGEGRPGPAMSMGVPQMTDQESSDRDNLAAVAEWLGLLDASPDQLRGRVAGRPLGSTTDDIRQIEVCRRFVDLLASRLFDLREGLRGSISEHIQEHDSRLSMDSEKAASSDPRR